MRTEMVQLNFIMLVWSILLQQRIKIRLKNIRRQTAFSIIRRAVTLATSLPEARTGEPGSR